MVFAAESFPGLAAMLDQDLNTILTAGDPLGVGVITGWFVPPAMNDAGQLAFVAQSSDSDRINLATNSGGTSSPVLFSGDGAPGGGTFIDFGGYLLAINNSGLMAFDGTVSAPGRSGLFQLASTGVSSVVQVGDPAPGGGAFEQIGPGSMNDSGQVAFQAVVGSPGRSGTFLWSAGTTVAIAQTGDAAPGGGIFAYVYTPSLNDAGQNRFRRR